MMFSFLHNNSVVQQQLKPILEKLRQDPDGDVQYYAVEALDSKNAFLYGAISRSFSSFNVSYLVVCQNKSAKSAYLLS